MPCGHDFTGFGLLFRHIRTETAAILSLSFCFLIECSQLYHAPWIDAIRSSTLGGLILGWQFVWSDIFAYTLGVCAAALLECSKRNRQPSS